MSPLVVCAESEPALSDTSTLPFTERSSPLDVEAHDLDSAVHGGDFPQQDALRHMHGVGHGHFDAFSSGYCVFTAT